MVEAALRYLASLGGQEVKTVHEDEERKVVSVSCGGAKEVFAYDKLAPARNHTFLTIESLCSFLVERGPGVVFVNKDQVKAALSYGKPRPEFAFIKLEKDPSFKALEKLSSGVDMKTLWRLLVTDLDGCMDPALLLAVQSVTFSNSSTNSVSIQNTGIVDSSGCRSIQLMTTDAKNGTQTANKIALEWIYKGRVFECSDTRFEVKTRLEIDTDDGVKFIFHLPRVHDVMRAAVNDVALKIGMASKVAEGAHAVGWEVYVGTL